MAVFDSIDNGTSPVAGNVPATEAPSVRNARYASSHEGWSRRWSAIRVNRVGHVQGHDRTCWCCEAGCGLQPSSALCAGLSIAIAGPEDLAKQLIRVKPDRCLLT
jgi:hypothetical protein